MKIPMFPCKYHQNGGFSMAMLVLGKVYIYICVWVYTHLYHLNPVHIPSYTMHEKTQMTQLLFLWDFLYVLGSKHLLFPYNRG